MAAMTMTTTDPIVNTRATLLRTHTRAKKPDLVRLSARSVRFLRTWLTFFSSEFDGPKFEPGPIHQLLLLLLSLLCHSFNGIYTHNNLGCVETEKKKKKKQYINQIRIDSLDRIAMLFTSELALGGAGTTENRFA